MQQQFLASPRGDVLATKAARVSPQKVKLERDIVTSLSLQTREHCVPQVVVHLEAKELAGNHNEIQGTGF